MSLETKAVPDWAALAQAEIKRYPQRRIWRCEWAGESFWIKRAPPAKATFWHHLQKGVAALLPDIFRPTPSPGGAVGLAGEAARLQRWQEAGIRVPVLYHADTDFLLMGDMGPDLNRYLQQNLRQDPAAQSALLHQAAQALSDLHKVELCHGRPHLRDMALTKEGIGFLDLEEDPLAVMNLASAQARDLWLFLNAAARYADISPDLLSNLAQDLLSQARPETRAALHRMVRILRPVRILAQLIVPIAGKDVKHAVMANQALEALDLR